MLKEEFEKKIIDLVDEYSGANIKALLSQSMTIRIGKDSLPSISLESTLISKKEEK